MPQLILIGKDWKARALLRVQLLEESIEVRAYETVADALEGMNDYPQLVMADLSGSSQASLEFDQLAHWTKFLPIWILASHNFIADTAVERRGFERILFRPVNIGELASDIKKRLEPALKSR